MTEYRIPSTPEGREAARQIRLDERSRIVKHLQEIADDVLGPPHDMLMAFIARHPEYVSERQRTVVADVLRAVAEEIENPDTDQPGSPKDV